MSTELPDPSKIKLITTDLDGTLINPQGDISQNTRTIIKKILKKYPDLHFVIATGRARPATADVREKLGITERPNTESLLLNGCIIYDYKGNIIWQNTLPTEFVLQFHNLLKNYPKEDYFYSSEDDAIMFNEEWARRSRENYHENTIVVDKEEHIKKVASGETKINKLCFIVTDSEDNKKIKEQLIEMSKAYNLEYAYSTSFFLEFMPPQTNKGTGLTHLIQSLNISKDEVLAFGDAGNDVDLLKNAGWPVAMANGTKELKAVSRIETKSNEEDGVAYLLEKIFL
ncbi:hypothetical protein LY90DRAFT_698838 [Neocallimastix californiae]|jgi:hypothetical protein|uniref:HAD-like protein n=1 Tax=Neocallimastix californiae TaxID=1754190 RepID=A0A1Y2EX20_9FUNG|nr:hypothetical protein LY90DRAFT_698838 [Neocallimastix californiae]|eukprot:ORY76151.1 hypothetical protein LY90DRAFT_698838 [Neocallimastix californiae]